MRERKKTKIQLMDMGKREREEGTERGSDGGTDE